MKTFTWNILKEPFQKDKVVSDVAKISFHGYEEYIWENLYWRDTELYSIFFLRGCKYLDLTKNVLSEELNS